VQTLNVSIVSHVVEPVKVSQGSPSLSDAVKDWLNSLYSSISSQNEEKQGSRQRRFLMRAFRGVSVGIARGYRFRWFVLTESNEAIAAGKDFGREFHRFLVWLRYYCPDFQYIVVEHRLPRRHWHILSYGTDKLPVDAMREYWRGHFLSTVTGMQEIREIDKAIYYVAGYLKRGGKLTRCWCSRGWVFPGWLGFSREYHARYGQYPRGELLVELALLDVHGRDYEKMFLLESGYMSSEVVYEYEGELV